MPVGKLNKQRVIECIRADDEALALELVDAIFGGITEDEFIEVRRRTSSDRFVSHWFRSSSEVLQLAGRCSATDDVYFGVTPRLGRTKDDDGVSRFTTLWADVDSKCYEG